MVICVKTLADELHGLKDASHLKMEPAYLLLGTTSVCMPLLMAVVVLANVIHVSLDSSLHSM